MAKKRKKAQRKAAKRTPSRRGARSTNDRCEGEMYDGDVVRTALIDGAGFHAKPVQYVEVDGLAIFEGDIVLGTCDAVERNTQVRRQERREGMAAGVVVTGSNRRWTNCVVPYTIDPNLPNTARVTDAIAHWEANTNYRFVERDSGNAAQHPDYITFRPASGCSSHVGRQGGQQFINLASGCSTGNTIHEIGHAIGLWHEQSREDRDSFVTINWDKIVPGREHNFNQHIADGDDVGAYDYGSIMHYPRNAFSIDGSDTITPIDATASIGQRSALSAGDIAAANSLCSPQVVTTQNKFADDGPVTLKFVDDGPRTANKFLDDGPKTILKFLDDGPLTTNKFVDDGPQTVNKFADDGPQTALKFLDDGPRTSNKFIDDGGGGGGTPNKHFDDVKTPAYDVGHFGPRLPFALATPHHAPDEAVRAAGGCGGQADVQSLSSRIAQLDQYVSELQQAIEMGYSHHDGVSLHDEQQRAVALLREALAQYDRLGRP